MRFSIIGHAGSGKSTLARQISEQFSIPHLHIDSFWFEGRGHRLQKDDEAGKARVRELIRAKVAAAIEGEDWVSDGFYPRVQPLIAERAERIIFLDIPLWRRLFNQLKRMAAGRRQADLSLRDDFYFLARMIRRSFKYQPVLEQFVKTYAAKSVVLRSYADVRKFLEGVRRDDAG